MLAGIGIADNPLLLPRDDKGVGLQAGSDAVCHLIDAGRDLLKGNGRLFDDGGIDRLDRGRIGAACWSKGDVGGHRETYLDGCFK